MKRRNYGNEITATLIGVIIYFRNIDVLGPHSSPAEGFSFAQANCPSLLLKLLLTPFKQTPPQTVAKLGGLLGRSARGVKTLRIRNKLMLS